MLGAVLLGLAGYGLYSVIGNAQPAQVGRPLDPDGLACGASKGLEQYPFMYFPTPYEDYIYRAVCVAQCPHGGEKALRCRPNRLIPDCSSKPSLDNISEQVLVYPSQAYKSWACLPKQTIYFRRIKEALEPTFFQSLVIDVQELWLLLLLVFASLSLSTCILVKATELPHFAGLLLLTTVGLLLGAGGTGLAILLLNRHEFNLINSRGGVAD
jgi:hypothetical protein